jgi:hypothetical protein
VRFSTEPQYSIPLNIGWNLISIPLVPEEDNTSINFVFDSEISENAEFLWEYKYDENQGMNVWKYNVPSEEGSSWTSDISRVQSIIPGHGYYIKMSNESEVYQNGNRFYGIEGPVPQPPQIILTPGWNLIGHYGMEIVDKTDEINDLSGGILTDLADITLLDENAYSTAVLVPTKGYWAFITGQDNIWYAPSDADYPAPTI